MHGRIFNAWFTSVGGAVGLILTAARASEHRPADIAFTGLLRSGGVTHVVLLNPLSGRSSGWIQLGQSFEGFSASRYDPLGETLTVTKEKKEIPLPLIADARIKSEYHPLKIAERGYRVRADRIENLDGVLIFSGKVTGVSLGSNFTCERLEMDPATGDIRLIGNVHFQSGSSLSRGPILVLRTKR